MYTKNSIRPEWIIEGFNNEEPIIWAKEFASFLARSGGQYIKETNIVFAEEKTLSTSKLRKFFGQVKRIQAEGFDNSKSKLLMLSPQLAYTVGRDKKVVRGQRVNETKINFLADELIAGLRYVTEKPHFKNFVNLMEAIVAYHKAEGGE